MADDDKVWLSLAEVADMLGVHPRTIRRRIKEGAIPGYKVGQQIRIRRDDVGLLLERVPLRRPTDA
jgi:excisionase family DNA binding protein